MTSPPPKKKDLFGGEGSDFICQLSQVCLLKAAYKEDSCRGFLYGGGGVVVFELKNVCEVVGVLTSYFYENHPNLNLSIF